MPELPDIVVYLEALQPRILGRRLEQIRLSSPFLLRTASPPPKGATGKVVRSLRRLGKRIAIGLDEDYWLVLHLMVAGRLKCEKKGAKVPGRVGLAAFDFSSGTLILTEASTRKRASLHLVAGEAGLVDFQRGGLEVMGATLDEFKEALLRENHTLKRSLTNPRLFGGIGNAYSDEILHRAGLSPLALTKRLNAEEVRRLYEATRTTLNEWTEKLRQETKGRFPEGVTAFREGMAVHGKYGKPCPRCGVKVQRIRYAENEANYCPRCQTGGKVLADRALSRLLKQDWPRTIEEIEGLSRRQGNSR